MEMDRNVLRTLMDDPEFLARVETVATGAGYLLPKATANANRLQVASTPSVYSAYVDAEQVADIGDAALLEGLQRTAFDDYPVPDLIGE